jgi:muconolactone delta-isomerase
VQFLVLSRRRTDVFPPEAWTPELIAAEGQRVRELYTAGIIRTIWRRKDIAGAVIVMEAASEEEAREAAASLPLAKRDMLEIVTLTQLEPYPGFAPR